MQAPGKEGMEVMQLEAQFQNVYIKMFPFNKLVRAVLMYFRVRPLK